MQIRCEQPCQAALQRQVAAPPVARQQPLVVCLGRLQLSNIHTQVDSFVVYGYAGTPAAGGRAGYAGMLRRALWLRRLRRSVRRRACGRQGALLKALVRGALHFMTTQRNSERCDERYIKKEPRSLIMCSRVSAPTAFAHPHAPLAAKGWGGNSWTFCPAGFCQRSASVLPAQGGLLGGG